MKFGLLSYNTHNIGDYIQSLAAAKFLPSTDRYLDRESLDDLANVGKDALKVVMNGWFCHRPDRWPPAPSIDPLLVSVHVSNNPEPGSGMRARECFGRNPRVLDYLRQREPVGARDLDTLDWLRSVGVKGFFSGCLTLTLDRPAVPKSAAVVLNDLPSPVIDAVRRTTDRPIVVTNHIDLETIGVEARLQRARDLMSLYASAACVVSSRLHGVLPCLAFGTPTLLVEASWDQSRFTGLRDLVRYCSVAEITSAPRMYDVNDPPANPERHHDLCKALTRRATDFVAGEVPRDSHRR